MISSSLTDLDGVAYTELQYSRDQVLAAGEALRRRDSATGAFVDLPADELRTVREVIDNWRGAHNRPLVTLRMNLQNHVGHVGPHRRLPIVAQRIKREESIRHKLRRFAWLNLLDMQDIGGLRAIVSTVGQVRELRDRHKQGRSKRQRFIREDDYLDDKPKASGYRGIHLIYAFDCPGTSWHDLNIEIQLRTLLQHEWATTNEVVGYGRGEKFKSGEGDPRWLRMFTLTGAAFAHMESTKPPIESAKTYGPIPATLQELRAEIAALEKELKFTEYVNGFGFGFQHVSTDPNLKASYYFLLRLDLGTNRLTITPYRRDHVRQAEAALAKAESERTDAVDVCLVSVQQMKNLRKAYPNYYLDTGQFVQRLRTLIRDATSSSTAASA